MKRITLFITVNILVVALIAILTSALGIGPYISIYCFLWGMAGPLVALLLSKKIAKWIMGVQLVTLEGPHQNVVKIVHRLARRAGLTQMPEVGIYQSEILNSFATGPSRNNSLVAVSSGLLANMDEREVEGVLAHEVSHIANGDMVTMILIQGVVNAFVMLFSFVVTFALTQSMSNDDRERQPNPVIQMMLFFVLNILFGILAAPIVAWFSRYREFRADRAGADLAGKDKMLAALEALSRAYPKMEALKEVNDSNFKSMQISSKDRPWRLFSCHPPLAKRIAILQRD